MGRTCFLHGPTGSVHCQRESMMVRFSPTSGCRWTLVGHCARPPIDAACFQYCTRPSLAGKFGREFRLLGVNVPHSRLLARASRCRWVTVHASPRCFCDETLPSNTRSMLRLVLVDRNSWLCQSGHCIIMCREFLVSRTMHRSVVAGVGQLSSPEKLAGCAGMRP